MSYYEIHVTTDPVFDGGEVVLLKSLCAKHGFKVAELLKRNGASHDLDSFATAHSKTYGGAVVKTLGLLGLLKTNGFKIRRYKIEHCILDSRTDDSAFPLGSS